MKANRHVALLVVTLVALFAPLAYSDLPDQTWHGGLWDGGDNDDVILQLESTGCTVETFAVCASDPILVVLGTTIPPPETAIALAPVSGNQTRAPPVP